MTEATAESRIRRPGAGATESGSSLRHEILRLAWPAVAEQLLGTLSQMVDMLLVGPLGPVAVAAVGLSTQPLWALMGPFAGLATGLGALVARSVGGGDPEEACAATRQGFWLGTVLSLLMGLAVGLGAEVVLRWMGGQPDVIPVGAAYLAALSPGLAALFWGLVMGGALRAAGDTRTPFVVSAGVNVLNLVLAWGLIYGHLGLPALGLMGAGVATSIARTLGAVVLFVALVRGRNGLSLDLNRLWRIDLALMRRIVNVSVPAAVDRVAGSLAYVVYVRLISTLGTVAVAAHIVAVTVEQVSWMVGTGLTTAAATLVGQSLGARQPDRAHRVVRESLLLGALFILPVTVWFLGFPGPFVRLFNGDAQVVALAIASLRVAALGEVPMIACIVLQGALAGAGDTRVLAAISLTGGWVVRLGFAALFLFAFGWGVPGAWAASVLDWLVRLVLELIRFRGGRWRELDV